MTADEKGLGRRALALMRPGPFRRYIIGSAISDTGTWMQVMAQGWVMSTLTDKAIMLGMVNFAAGLPTLALTMFGGSVADRFDKRKILIATQVVQITLALILGWLVLTNRIHVWHILILAALLGVSIAFEMPAISALVPELVKREEIAAAIALDRLVGSCLRFFCERSFVYRADRRAHLTSAAHGRDGGRGRAAPQRNQRGLQICGLRADYPVDDLPDRAHNRLRLPRNFGNAAALRKKRSSSRPGSNGILDGGIGDWFAGRFPRPTQRRSRESTEIHDLQRGGRGRGDLLHVAILWFLRDCDRNGISRHRSLHEFRARKHDRAGTSAHCVARPRLRYFWDELLRSHADRRLAHHGIVRPDWNPHCARRFFRYLWYRRFCRPHHRGPTCLRSPGCADSGTRSRICRLTSLKPNDFFFHLLEFAASHCWRRNVA